MHLSAAAVVLFGAQLAAASTCKANNCLRAVIASAFTTRHGSADCSSFFLTIVTPAVVTGTISTAISTFTATAVASTIPLSKRDAIPASPLALIPRQVTVIPSSVPAYASACSGTSGYSSACSCIGITPMIVEVPTPTSYVIVSYTTTISYTGCGDPPAQFLLQLFNSGTALDGTYASDEDSILFTGANSSDAGFFSLNSAGNLIWDGYLGALDYDLQFGKILFNDLPQVYTRAVYVVCSIAGGTLACQAGAGIDILQVCPDSDYPTVLNIGSTLQSGCYVPTLKVVPVC